jgi:photosystem II stability/assembly factor-like uncharacterized protein
MSNTSRNRTNIPPSVWKKSYYPGNGIFRAATTDGNKIVAVGDGGLIKTSTNGNTWTQRDSGQRKKQNLYAVTYSKDKDLFVAVGKGGAIVTSGDGKHWIEVSPGRKDAPSFTGVAYGNNTFVAVGILVKWVNEKKKTLNVVKVSKDGMIWRDARRVPRRLFNNIFFDNGLFVIPAINTTIYTSKDGESFTKHHLKKPANINLYSAAYGNGTWVVGGAYGVCFSSGNGKDWTLRDTNTKNHLMGIVWTGEEFVANGNADDNPKWGAMIQVSPDGIDWQRETTPRGIRPRGGPCTLGLRSNVCLGNKVFAMGAYQLVISKDKDRHSSGEPGVTPVTKPTPVKKDIQITSPDEGEVLEAGSVHNITWQAPGIRRHVMIEYSIDNGKNWLPLDNDTKNDGIRDWTVPGTVSGKCKIKISDVGGPSVGISAEPFVITDGKPPPDQKEAVKDQIRVIKNQTADIQQRLATLLEQVEKL